jgi:hypothetical protein
MADFRKLGKGVAGALQQAQQLAAAEREANLAKFLTESKTPMRLYHGTMATEGGKAQEAIRRFKPSKEGALGSGVYLTPKSSFANTYADTSNLSRSDAGMDEIGGQNVLPVHAQIKNPLIIEGNGDPMIEALIKLGMDEDKAVRMVERAYDQKGYIGKEVETRARAAGYDGLMQYRDGDLNEVVSYNPNAVKSAIGNEGTYDITSPDLSKAQGGGIHMQAGGKALKGALSAFRKASEEASALSKVQGTQDVLPKAQAEANKAAMLAKTKDPRQFYHGSQADIKKFIPSHKGSFVSPDPEFASRFSEGATGMHGPNVMPVRVMVENPFDYDNPEHMKTVREAAKKRFPGNKGVQYELDAIAGVDDSGGVHNNWASIEHPDVQRLIKELGFDAYYTSEAGTKNLGIYDPKRIKSDIGNRGTYDTTKGDINEARGGAIHMQKGGKTGALGKIAQAIKAANKEADATLASGKLEEALKAKQAPMTTPSGTGLPLMPRSAGMYTPGVEQKDLPRMPMVDKARAANQQPKYTERMQDLLDSPTARKKIDKLINQGKDLNVQEWYGTEPLRQVAMDIGMSQKQFDEFLAQMASASQRNPVDQQNKMGSYLYHLSQTGQLPDDAFLMTNKIKRGKAERPEGTAIELPPGYGSLAQGDIFSRGKQIASGDIEGALPPDKKLGTFYRNYQGNLKPVTVDVNAVRGPIIERGDPRWLASKLVEKDEEGNVIATHFPRKDVESGKMSLKEAKARPGFWEAAPSGSEYAGFEDLWQRGAKRHGMAPAEAQALGWYGSADVTALKTKPELYIDNLERMIKRTAEQTGQNPRLVMEDVLRGKQYLKAKGGSVSKQPTKIKAYGKDIEAKIHDEFAHHINAAKGGEIKKMPWKAAQGGVAANPSMDNTMPDRSDAGGINYAPKFANGGNVRRFDNGGSAARIPGQSVSAPPPDQPSKAKLMAEILARMAKEQGKEEVGSLTKPRTATDLLNRGVVAPAVGAPVDILNMGLEGIDAVRDLASGKPVANRFASEKPFLGSEHLKDLMKQYGMTSETERPMMETALSIASPGAAVRGATKAAQMAPKALRAGEAGLNTATAAMRRPMTPATVTMEAVAPDLAKYKPRDWQETATKRMTGPGAPVSMETMGGQRTTKRPGQGVYENFEGQLETNPLVAVDVPRAGNLSTNKALRADIVQGGQDLAQESVAAHRFVPMMTNNIADASAMLISPKGGKLTNEEVVMLGQQLPGMIVAHNPRLGGVVVMPYDQSKGKVPTEFFDAQDVAKSVLGKRANFTYGKSDPAKDRLYIERGDYATEGAKPSSAESKAMRERLQRAEGRLFREPAQSPGGLRQARAVPATTAD